MNTLKEDKIEKICMEMQISSINAEELCSYFVRWLEKKEIAQKEDRIEKMCIEIQLWSISVEELNSYYVQWLKKKRIVNEAAVVEVKEKEDFPFEVLYSDGLKSKTLRWGTQPVAIIVSESLGISFDDVPTQMSWYKAEKYCKNLMIGNKKWCLPDTKQLKILYEKKESIDKILEAFERKPLQEFWCWSSVEDYSDLAMAVSLHRGNVSRYNKSFNWNVRPVLDLKEDFPFAVLYSDGCKSKNFYSDVEPVAIMVSETLGISFEDASSEINWNEAIEYCENLTIGNKKWQLPNKEELKILYDQKEEINKILECFGKKVLKNSWYWSSTEYGTDAWVLDISDGDESNGFKYDNNFNVRPVLV